MYIQYMGLPEAARLECWCLHVYCRCLKINLLLCYFWLSDSVFFAYFCKNVLAYTFIPVYEIFLLWFQLNIYPIYFAIRAWSCGYGTDLHVSVSR